MTLRYFRHRIDLTGVKLQLNAAQTTSLLVEGGFDIVVLRLACILATLNSPRVFRDALFPIRMF